MFAHVSLWVMQCFAWNRCTANILKRWTFEELQSRERSATQRGLFIHVQSLSPNLCTRNFSNIVLNKDKSQKFICNTASIGLHCFWVTLIEPCWKIQIILLILIHSYVYLMKISADYTLKDFYLINSLNYQEILSFDHRGLRNVLIWYRRIHKADVLENSHFGPELLLFLGRLLLVNQIMTNLSWTVAVIKLKRLWLSVSSVSRWPHERPHTLAIRKHKPLGLNVKMLVCFLRTLAHRQLFN